ncbi:MAG TPA: protein phosphatase 2C domain-containing protein, partial [Pseudonocardiaceae bacterium]|nr:protein phosphatase 2C domain-containing protein [Pseudonocardiaceae bacterium]
MAGSDRGTRWRIAAASVAGPNHVMSAVSNQDKLRVHRLDNGAMVFAVADGAGSRSRSEEGALCAVDAAVSAARHLFNGRLPANDTDWTT